MYRTIPDRGRGDKKQSGLHKIRHFSGRGLPFVTQGEVEERTVLTADYEKLVKITSKLWSEKGYNVCALWKMSKITNALSGLTLKPSPCRSSGKAVPKQTE